MPAFVVGDVHGQRDTLTGLLRAAGLIDASDRWCGADARLWLLGDLVDRGPDGIGTIDLVMSLQEEADVRCLLGNHEVLLLGAARWGDVPILGTDVTFRESRDLNGGRPSDLQRLEAHHCRWIEGLPAVGREGDWLLVHADTARYLELGSSAGEIVAMGGRALRSADPADLGVLLEIVSERHGFQDPTSVLALLGRLGGEWIVHGHTPVFFVTGREPHEVTEPLVYGGGRVLNVDHCLFAGGPGFVVRLDSGSWELAEAPAADL